MKLIMAGTNQHQEQTIPWTKDIRGPYAAEQSMARKPMEEGETRHLKMYIPDVNRVVEFTLTAGPISEVALGDGSTRPLRKIVQTATLDGKARPELAATLWADSSGQVLKSEVRLAGRHRDVSHHQGGRNRPGRREESPGSTRFAARSSPLTRSSPTPARPASSGTGLPSRTKTRTHEALPCRSLARASSREPTRTR